MNICSCGQEHIMPYMENLEKKRLFLDEEQLFFLTNYITLVFKFYCNLDAKPLNQLQVFRLNAS